MAAEPRIPPEPIVIRSADAEVRGLVTALGGESEARREAAIARLTIIGRRAVARLVQTYGSGDRPTQLAILRVLEASGDERSLTVARHALAAGGDFAVGAVAVLGELLGRGDRGTQDEALEALLGVATDAAAGRRVRTAAARALEAASESIRSALDASLGTSTPDEALWQDAVDGRLPDEPASLRDAAASQAERAPLATLRQMIEAIQEREHAAGTDARRQEWRRVRGALHQALALRGSRIALYDLRETLERATGPLPTTFLAAVQVIGDPSCLEPLAAAHAKAGGHAHWRHQLEQAFRTVARRERLTARHSAMRRALARSPLLARPVA